MENLQDLQEQACERIQKEMDSLVVEWLKHDKKWLIDNAYEIACSKDINWFFSVNIIEDAFDGVEEIEDMLKDIINYEGYFISDFYDYYLGMDENFHNIISTEDCAEMIINFLGYNDYGKKERVLEW